jgi:putative DNA primase/helicase
MRYIILHPDKTPAEKLSAGGHPWNEVEDFDNVGLLLDEPFIAFDFDTVTDGKIMLKIVTDLGSKCGIMQTTRGYHFLFKTSEPWKRLTKARAAIGIYYDIKSWGKLCYIVIKQGGALREWLQLPKLEDMDEPPQWLKPVTYAKHRFAGMSDGEGRNQALFDYILVLQGKGFGKEQIRETAAIINKYVFAEPLPDSEMAVILRDEAFKPSAGGGFFDDTGGFKHHKFAEFLCQKLNIVTVNEQCYIYKDGYYQKAERHIDKEMIALYPRIRRSQRAEVVDYIKILTHLKPENTGRQEYIINLSNTRLDLRNGNALPFDPSVIDFCRIPVVYDPGAYCADLDKMLNKVFAGDREVIDLFEEMAGYMLIKNCRFRKGFLFYGSGSNGKSTVLNLLKTFIGADNCATIEMEKLSERFKPAELENKLVNIGDDLNQRAIVDTGTIKKLFSGESVTVERKGQTPFTLKNYAKMIFSCNEMPRIADKSHGMYSRLTLIPFTAVFSPEDEDFDPFVEDKVTTDEALSYLLNIALRGLRRLLHHNGFTSPKVVAEALEKYKVANSAALTWAEEEGLDKEELVSQFTDTLYSRFCDWCARGNIKHVPSSKLFNREIETKYMLDKKRIRNNATGGAFKWQFIVRVE